MVWVCLQRDKPRFWFVFGGTLAVLSVLMLIGSVIIKTVLYSSVLRAVYYMRYIDNVDEVSGCAHPLLGDSTCPGKRFEAWSMPSREKYATCMDHAEPGSRSVAMASKWCGPDDPGCEKQSVCRPGETFTYHFFSVLNPLEVMDGHPAQLQEMEPIRILKTTDKVNVDHSRLLTDGTLTWNEASAYSLIDPRDEHLLDQVVVIPNPTMFGAARDGNDRTSADAIVYFTAAAVFYDTVQEKINNMTASLDAKTWFNETTKINFPTLVKDQYRSASFTLALGEILASPACPLLIPLLVAGLSSPIPGPAAAAMLCSSRFRGNVGMSMYSSLLSVAKLTVRPSDALFFYEFEKNCSTLSEFPSNACYVDPADAQPSLTQSYTDELFELFANVSAAVKQRKESPAAFLSTLAKIVQFLTNDCLVGSVTEIDDPVLCDKLTEQLMRAGRSAMTTNHPQWKAAKELYGWSSSVYDAGKLAPYFIRATVREIMGFGRDKPLTDPLTGKPFAAALWVNSLRSDGSFSDFTKGPFTQRVSSMHGSDGLHTFASMQGRNESCAFDFGCLVQPGFTGGSCVREPGVCEPDAVSGRGPGFVPGNIFDDRSGLGTGEFHQVGAKQTMMAPEMFLKGTFTATSTDDVWLHNVRVDKWALSGINLNLRSCDLKSDKRKWGMDCVSPAGTKNVGHHVVYDTGLTPALLYAPMFVSFPWFQQAAGGSMLETPETSPYDPLEKVEIRKCDSCAEARDFRSQLFTEPETGAHIFGQQFVQVNIRVAGEPAARSRPPGTTGKTVDATKLFMKKDVDLLIPLFWMAKEDSVLPFQAAKLATLQAVPRTLNVVFGILLGGSILCTAIAWYLLRRGLKLKRFLENGGNRVSSEKLGARSTELGDTERASTIESMEGIQSSRPNAAGAPV